MHGLEGTRLVFPKDYQDLFFNVRGGVRHTGGFDLKPALPFLGRIWVLGGSTTYCSEVPDNLTWPSLLQDYINKGFPDAQFEVVNFGVTTVNSYQELQRLKYELTAGGPPAICLFYDGVNDVIQGTVYNNPKGTIFESAIERERRLIPNLRKWSAFFDRAVEITAGIIKTDPSYLKDPIGLKQRAVETATNYENNIRAASRLCKAQDIELFVFLQPCLYTINRKLTSHETGILRTQPESFQVAFELTYPETKKTIARLKAADIRAYDLSGIFDSNQKPIFLDFCHVESDGNAIIAKNVFRVIRPALVNLRDKKPSN